MVFDEARALGVPMLTTATTSAHEMVADTSCGVVCDNTEKALCDAFCQMVADRAALAEHKARLAGAAVDNRRALAQWDALFEE